MTVLNPPISMATPNQRGSRVDDFVNRLSNPLPAKTTGVFGTAFLTLISFGLLPLLIWPPRWAEFLETERHDLLDLIAWWRRRVAPSDAAELDKITRRLRPRPMLTVLPWLAVGFNFVLMATLLTQGDRVDRLWDLTFRQAAPSQFEEPVGDHWELAVPLESHLHSAWIISLCLGYFCQWYAVRSHAVAVNSLSQWTNKLARENQFLRVQSEVLKIGSNPLWIILGIALCTQCVWWAIPMVFAGAMQRRYVCRSSPAIRIALAGQARDSFAIVQSSNDRFCTAEHCAARLPAPARFCPRCGTAV